MSTIMNTLCPRPGELPTASLYHYEDGTEPIPVVNFLQHHNLWQLNLGGLTYQDAAAYLEHLALSASKLADECREEYFRPGVTA